MNKKELVQYVSDEMMVQSKDVDALINTVLKGIEFGLKRDGKVSFAGFGSFKLSTRSARKGRNPKTGEEIDIPEKTTVRFSASTVLKQVISE